MPTQSRLPYQTFLSNPVGKGFASSPHDIESIREGLRQLKLYQGTMTKNYMDKELENSIRELQRQEGLTVDGILYPSGETERALNRNLIGETNAFGARQAARVELTKSVGEGQANQSDDVKVVQRALGTLGYIPKSRGFEPNGIIDDITNKGIRQFQKRNELKADGRLKPGGETMKAMNVALLQEIGEEIEEEPLPPPDIPGTDIPDEGIIEGGGGIGYPTTDPTNDDGIVIATPPMNDPLEIPPGGPIYYPRYPR